MEFPLTERGPGSSEVGRFAGIHPFIPDHELFRRIGRGSYGEVWLARSITGAWRAVKVIYRRTAEQEKAFEREFRGIQSYEPISRTDDSLMGILHVGRSEQLGFFYYVME